MTLSGRGGQWFVESCQTFPDPTTSRTRELQFDQLETFGHLNGWRKKTPAIAP
ncbi:hypothetical protein AM571_PB00166 (plasmid) [Rhizobium etli 8C-3]|uniref:Uncharacterized protein n=1 Tax=Rhizobium etli 8C-3 TaxID=538025 RepID=A0A1L5PB47_RHIET|nr:hypothetical protein AM571_PB00166 [Rhizobium etli 8C-3]ARM14861.1 hypothetical protein Bra5_PB00110 [Rhizobium phaseoli Brasil 5]